MGTATPSPRTTLDRDFRSAGGSSERYDTSTLPGRPGRARVASHDRLIDVRGDDDEFTVIVVLETHPERSRIGDGDDVLTLLHPTPQQVVVLSEKSRHEDVKRESSSRASQRNERKRFHLRGRASQHLISRETRARGAEDGADAAERGQIPPVAAPTAPSEFNDANTAGAANPPVTKSAAPPIADAAPTFAARLHDHACFLTRGVFGGVALRFASAAHRTRSAARSSALANSTHDSPTLRARFRSPARTSAQYKPLIINASAANVGDNRSNTFRNIFFFERPFETPHRSPAESRV